MPRMRRYEKMAFRTPVVFIEPGGRTRNNAGQFVRTSERRHDGYFCNLRARTANERLTGTLDLSKIISTAVFIKTSIFDRITAEWKAEINGKEHELIGGVELLERETLVRLTLEQLGSGA